MSEEVRAENCSDFSHVVQSCGRIVHEFYGTIYANKENGKLESNKRMWLYEKIHISILDRKSTRLNSSHPPESRMPSSA